MHLPSSPAPGTLETQGRLLFLPTASAEAQARLSSEAYTAWKTSVDWITQWIAGPVTKPNPYGSVTKEESVCRFSPPALQLGFMLFAIAQPTNPNSLDAIYAELYHFADIFESLNPKEYPKNKLKNINVIFPNTPDSVFAQLDGDKVDPNVRMDLYKRGIMFANANPSCNYRAKFDPTVFAMRAPVPLFSIRTFVEQDWHLTSVVPEFRQIYIERFGQPPVDNPYTGLKGWWHDTCYRTRECLKPIKQVVKKLLGRHE